MLSRLLLWLAATGSTLGVASFTAPAPAPRSVAPRSIAPGALELRAHVELPAQDPQGKEEKFTHKGHVDRIWFNPEVQEVWRDCRGCHVFDAAHPVSAPQQHCDACHLKDNLGKAFKKQWQADLGGWRTRTRDAFRHHTHGMLECRECHLPEKTRFLSDFDIVTGPGQCERCHEVGAAQAPAKAGGAPYALFQKWRLFAPSQDKDLAAKLDVPFYPAPKLDDATQCAEYADRLAKAFGGPTGGVNQKATLLPIGGDFDHWDHKEIVCASCHASIPTSSELQVGTGQIRVDDCGKCHIADEKRTAARAGSTTKTSKRELWSLGTFAHSDHFRFLAPGQKRRDTPAATDAAYAELELGGDKVCNACHKQVENTVGLAERDFPFAPKLSRHRYVDCAQCHAVPGWTTGEDEQKPLHAISGAHDDPGHWNECARCHTFGSDAFATTRPREDVQRATGRTFEFAAQTHPDISTGKPASGRAPLGECTTCHRSKVPELPSRLDRRPFRHASHLAATPDANACLECHPRAKTAATAADLAADTRTYTLTSCTKCHLGSAVKEVETSAPAPRRVVAFPHAPHVAKAACTECHTLATDGADELTKPKAESCEQCHDHKAATQGPTVERVFDDQVRSCAKCHDLIAPGKPGLGVPPLPVRDAVPTDWRYFAEQTAFAGFADAQFHPLGGKCADCHRAVPIQPGTESNMLGIKRVREDHLAATHKSPHFGQNAKDPKECLRCHWKKLDIETFRDGVRGTEAEIDLRSFTDPKKTRAEFGNSREGYPGTEKARG